MYTIEVLTPTHRTRYRCTWHEIANGALIIYDRGIIAAYAPGEWKFVYLVNPEEEAATE